MSNCVRLRAGSVCLAVLLVASVLVLPPGAGAQASDQAPVMIGAVVRGKVMTLYFDRELSPEAAEATSTGFGAMSPHDFYKSKITNYGDGPTRVNVTAAYVNCFGQNGRSKKPANQGGGYYPDTPQSEWKPNLHSFPNPYVCPGPRGTPGPKYAFWGPVIEGKTVDLYLQNSQDNRRYRDFTVGYAMPTNRSVWPSPRLEGANGVPVASFGSTAVLKYESPRVTATADEPYRFAASDFHFPHLHPVGPSSTLQIRTLPGKGRLSFDGVDVVRSDLPLNLSGDSSDSNSVDKLVYTPPDSHWSQSYLTDFEFRVNGEEVASWRGGDYKLVIDLKSDTLVSNVSPAPTSRGPVQNGQEFALPFRTGSDAGGYRLEALSVRLFTSAGAKLPDVKLREGSPTGPLVDPLVWCNLKFVKPAVQSSFGVHTYRYAPLESEHCNDMHPSRTTLRLKPDTTYYAMFSGVTQATGQTLSWDGLARGDVDSGSRPGWTLLPVQQRGGTQANATANWAPASSGNDIRAQMSIEGFSYTPRVLAAPVLRRLGERFVSFGRFLEMKTNWASRAAWDPYLEGHRFEYCLDGCGEEANWVEYDSTWHPGKWRGVTKTFHARPHNLLLPHAVSLRVCSFNGRYSCSNVVDTRDRAAPAIVAGAINDPAAQCWSSGDDARVTLEFDRAVTVTGTPRVKVDLSSSVGVRNRSRVNASYVSGSGSTRLVFGAALTAQQCQVNLVPHSLELNGGTIMDVHGVGAYLGHAAAWAAGTTNYSFIGPWSPSIGPLSPVGGGSGGGQNAPGGNSVATGELTVSGTARVGETLSVDTSGVVDADGIEDAVFAYRWLVGDVVVEGASGSVYVPSDGDVGKSVQALVAFADDAGHPESLVSGATAPVASEHLLVAEATAVDASVVLEFNELLDETPGGVPSVSAFDVVVGGDAVAVEKVSLRGRTLTLELDSPGSAPQAGDMVTVDYTKPTGAGQGFVRDTLGRTAASFDGQVVANLPGAPVGLVAAAASMTAIDLSWAAPVSNGGAAVSGHLIETSADGGATWQVLPAGGAKRSYAATGLEAGSTHSYRVSAVNSAGLGPVSSVVSGTADVLVTNTKHPTVGSDWSAAEVSQPFSTGSHSAGYDLAGVDIASQLVRGHDISAAVWTADDDGDPVAKVADLSLYSGTTSGRTPAGAIRFTAPDNTKLVADTDHALVLTLLPQRRGYYDVTGLLSENPGAAAGWAIGDGYRHRSSADGDWNDSLYNRSLRIAVRGAPGNSAAAGTPVISGTAEVGGTLTASVDAITDADGLADASFAYQWAAGGVDIAGATASTYTPTAADVGKTVTVTVTFADDAGNAETLTSSPTAAVDFATSQQTAANTAATGAPVISGTAEVGGTLTVSVDAITDADGLADASFAYQWAAGGVDIAGATASTYTPTAADVGKTVTVTVAFADDAGNAETLTSSPTAAVDFATSQQTAANTAATGAPVISGAAEVGGTLTASVDAVTDADGLADASFSYQWAAGGVDIAGATASTYAPTAADVGKTVTVTVAFADDAGNAETLTSLATAAVVAPNAPAAGAPVISGAAEVGGTLTASVDAVTDADGLVDASFAYQWTAHDGADGNDIAGATASTYAPTAADVGKTITVTVTFADDAGNAETLTSSPTAAVVAALTATTTGVTVSHDGATAFTFRLLFNRSLSLSYRTLRDHAFTVTGGEIVQARRLRFGEDIGWQIMVRPHGDGAVTVVLPPTTDCADQGAICARDNAKLSSRVTVTVPGPNRPAAGAPTIAGTAAVGETLTVATGAITDADGLSGVSFSYQWTAHDGADSTDIAGATASTYAPTAADVGKTITVTAAFADDAGNQEALTSLATAAVVPADAPNAPASGAPTVAGTAAVGETLTVATGAIADADGLSGVSFSYQWTAHDGADGTDIAGATASTYAPTAADVGKTITVTVTFADDAGNAETLTSAHTAAVAAALTARTTNVPASHNGSTFTFRLLFNRAPSLSYRTLRDHAFTVTGGEIVRARRLRLGQNIGWQITVRPDGDGTVTVVLPPTTDCTAQGAICTSDNVGLSSHTTITVPGPTTLTQSSLTS